jgi:hypothetical protein
MFHFLRSGRVVQTVIRDVNGRPVFLEILDTRTNARRIVYGPGYFNFDLEDRSKTDGPAVCTEDVPEVIEFYLEDEQCYFRTPNPASRQLVLFPGAFPYCKPRAGDLLIDQAGRTYAVQHAPDGAYDLPWNGCVLLDIPLPEDVTQLRWTGECRKRNLVSFQAEEGHPGAPQPGEEDSGADVGTLYRGIVAPTITHYLALEEPATVGPKPFGRDKELKPRVRQELLDPVRPQITLRIWGHWMEALYRFRCLHPRTAVASQLAAWFKRFMRNNTPSLRASGVQQILFDRRAEVPRTDLGGDFVSGFDVTFYFRTEELTVEESSNLTDLSLQFGAVLSQQASGTDLDGLGGLNPFTGLYDVSGNYAWGSFDLADFRVTGNPA